MSPIERLKAIGLNLPNPPQPVGVYVPGVKWNDQIFVSGQLPITDGQIMFPGTVGLDLNLEQGASAAELCALNALSILNEINNGLDALRIIKLTGFVRCIDSFSDHPSVLNGASKLFGQIFKSRGIHARAVVGVNSLPLGSAVELEVVAAIDKH